jgi:hypothetical protein
MNSPFKLKSPLLKEKKTPLPGTISTDIVKLGDVSQKSQDISSEKVVNNNTGGQTNYPTESPNETAVRLANVVNKGEGTTAFDRDGRSVDKFDQRIAQAESKGKLGRAQRLKNRKSGFMESQANKLERAGGTLSDQQKTDLNDASKASGGTRVGKALRVLGGREAKQREVDPVSLPVSKVNEITPSKVVSVGMDKPDFSAVTKKNGLSDEERASRRQASGNYNEDGTIKKDRD